MNLLEENLHQMLLITSNYNLASVEKLYEYANEAYEVNNSLLSVLRRSNRKGTSRYSPAT